MSCLRYITSEVHVQTTDVMFTLTDVTSAI